MAYEIDQLGNVIGEYESEEERKRRLDAEQAQTPVKQTITTNPDGTQEMTIKGTPQSLSSMNPNTPTVSGPADPADIFKRMLQVESGNKQLNKQGQIMTSNKGALGAAQIMPTTAMSPGYGVPSIFDLAEQQGIPVQNRDEATAKALLANEQLNRQFGANYYNAMNSRFGSQGGAAAYNGGPGRIERNMQANAGTMNVGQLPRETQGYLAKLGNMVGSVIPSAEAKTVPQAPANVGSSGFEPYDRNRPGNAAFQGGQPTYDRNRPGAAPFEGGAQPQTRPENAAEQAAFQQANANITSPLNLPDDPFQQYLNLPDSPRDKLAFAYDPNTPENLQKHVKKQVSDTLAHEAGFVKAEAAIKTMDENAVAKALREKTTGGSYIKAILFGLLGMENSKGAEIAKLGIGKETMALLGSDPVMVKVAANGTPISGINSKTGKELTAQELIAATQGAQAVKGTEVEAGTYMDPSGKVAGNWVLERRPGGSVYRQVGTGVIANEEQANALRKTGVGGTLSDQKAKMIQEINLKLVGKTQEEAMAILRPFNQALAGANLPIINPSELNIAAPQISGGAPAAGTTAAPTAATAPTPLPAAGPRPTMTQLKAAETKAEEEAKIIGTDMGKVKATQPQVESTADQLITQVDNLFKIGTDEKGFRDTVGVKGAGLGFGFFKSKDPQTGKIMYDPVAGTLEADFVSAFDQVKGATFLQAFETLRGGGQITEKEGAAASDAYNRMQLSQSEKEFKKAAQEFNDNVKRMIDIRREKLGLPPKYNMKPLSETEKAKESKKPVGTKENPIEIKF